MYSKYFSFYEQDRFRAQLSLAWKKFYNLGTWKYVGSVFGK